jgi:hypothetical protein
LSTVHDAAGPLRRAVALGSGYAAWVTAAHDHDDLQHLLDRLPPAQVRRLRALVESDPELSQYVEPSGQTDEGGGRRRLLSLIGSMDSGRGDLAERHDEIIREGWTVRRDGPPRHRPTRGRV